MRKNDHAKWQRVLALVFLSLAHLLNISGLMLAQDISTADRERLRRAERAADHFVQRYRETLDFGVVWKEFRAAKFVPRMRSLVMGNASPKAKREVSDALLEKGIVSLLNYLSLKSVHDLSVAKIESNVSEEQLTPKEIREAESSNKFITINGKEPKSPEELKAYIAEAEKMAKLYRRYVSPASFETPAYKENLLYLAEFYKPTEDNYRVVELEEEAGLGKGVKEYRVTRGAFHYAFVEERGKMKIIGIGMGN